MKWIDIIIMFVALLFSLGVIYFFRSGEKTCGDCEGCSSRICIRKKERKRMHKIMFVCHGNICRSPMAEFLLKDILEKQNKSGEFIVASSAVSTEEIYDGVGNPVYPPAKKLLSALGISCEGKRAQLLTKSDGEYYDLLLCMDDSNVARAKRIVGEENAEKVKKLLSFAGESGNVADPWYTRDFQAAYQDIMKGINGLLKNLE